MSVPSEIRSLWKELVRIHRKLAMADLPGQVVQRDTSKKMVRLGLTADPTSGEQVLSPWLDVKQPANQPGGFQIATPLPPIGTPMRMKSPSGVVGADSYAEHSGFNAASPAPSQADGEAQINLGNVSLSFKNGAFTVTVGGKGFQLTPSALQMSQKFIAEGAGQPVNSNPNLLA